MQPSADTFGELGPDLIRADIGNGLGREGLKEQALGLLLRDATRLQIEELVLVEKTGRRAVTADNVGTGMAGPSVPIGVAPPAPGPPVGGSRIDPPAPNGVGTPATNRPPVGGAANGRRSASASKARREPFLRSTTRIFALSTTSGRRADGITW